MENYIGRLLDNRYEILEIIGSGGMAVVYKALDHRLNRPVAVKILKDELSKNQEFRRRFHGESQAVAMLSHPNIVSVYDVSRTSESDYIVMELIEGITLKQYLAKKQSLNWRETLHFSMQIAKALDHAHSRGIVHRDIKPHNIMILKDGSIKVADFGIARVGSAQNTLTREALGSVHYISPEQAKGARVDNRSDLYSLGVVMYEMLTGRTPYDGETPVSVAIQHINGNARRPSELVSGIPAGLEQITMHAMTVNSDERYSSAAEMVRDMEEFRKNPGILFHFGSSLTMQEVTVTAEPESTPRTRSGMSRTEAERYAAARSGQGANARSVEERRAERARREAALAEKKRRNTIIIAICAAVSVLVILGVLIGGALSGWFSGSGNSKEDSQENSDIVEVENFVGMALEDIDPDDYPELSVDVENVTYRFSEEYAEGIVIEQSPRAGEQVKNGRKIKLVVSKGTEGAEMPDLVDYSEAEAIKLLQDLNLGLKTLVKDEVDSKIKEGNVARTEPEAGTMLSKNQEVILYVSLGEKKMPDLTNDTKNNAKARLEALDIRTADIIFLEEESDEVEEGRVIRTDPKAGEALEEGDKVTVYISTGSNKTAVPDVIGKSLSSALAMLEAADLDYTIVEYYDSQVPKDYVISQSHLPGDLVEKGTVIIIDVSLGPQPAESTDPPTESTEASTQPPTESTQPSESSSEEAVEVP